MTESTIMAPAGRRSKDTSASDERSEGGWGIVVVIAAHLTLALVDGSIRINSVFYRTWKNEFETSAGETAAIQSIMSSLSCLCGFIGGLLTKRFGCRLTGMLGGSLTTLGFFCSYWINGIMQLYITVALIGTGMGIALNPMLVAVALYFKRRYKTANAVAYSGAGTGAIVAPLLLQLLLDSYGWRGATLIVAATVANMIAFCAVCRPPSGNRSFTNRHYTKHGDTDIKVTVSGCETEGVVNANRTDACTEDFSNISSLSEPFSDELGKNIEVQYVSGTDKAEGRRPSYVALHGPTDPPKAFLLPKRLLSGLGLDVFAKSYCFALLCLLQIEFSIPCFGGLLYTIPRAESMDVAPSRAAFLLSIYGIGGMLGRLGHGLLISLKLSAEHVNAVCVALAGASLLLLNMDDYLLLAIASFLQGFATGAFYAINIVLTRRFVGLKCFTISIGLSFVCTGIGALIGPVTAGWLFDATQSYKTVFIILAGMFFACALQMVLLFPVLRRLEPGIDDKETHTDEDG